MPRNASHGSFKEQNEDSQGAGNTLHCIMTSLFFRMEILRIRTALEFPE